MTGAPTRSRLGAVAVTPRPLPAYCDMFQLAVDDLLAGPILDCPAGASSFGALVRAIGGEVTSVDPAYAAPDGLVDRVAADIARISAWQRANPAGFNWHYLGSPEELAKTWAAALSIFAADFAPDDARYVAAALPRLPFPDDRFALTLSGFLLFVYPELFGPDELLAALRELTRVTRGEVRVYPVLSSAGEPYAELPALRAALAAHGVDTEIRNTGCAVEHDPGQRPDARLPERATHDHHDPAAGPGRDARPRVGGARRDGRGRPRPYAALWADSADVTLYGAWGPMDRGHDTVTTRSGGSGAVSPAARWCPPTTWWRSAETSPTRWAPSAAPSASTAASPSR